MANQIKNKTHGVLSISVFLIALLIAVYELLNVSLLIGTIYIAVILLGFTCIIYSFCAKCSCRNNCSHIIIGPITNLLPKRKTGNYSTKDYIYTFISILSILIFPQYWLWKTPLLIIFFWLLIAFASIEINLFVCRKCNNVACKMCKTKKVELV